MFATCLFAGACQTVRLPTCEPGSQQHGLQSTELSAPEEGMQMYGTSRYVYYIQYRKTWVSSVGRAD